MHSLPKWPSSPIGPVPRQDVEVWCELVKQKYIESAGWNGPNWPGPPPVSGDKEVSNTAVGFTFTQIALVHNGIKTIKN